MRKKQENTDQTKSERKKRLKIHEATAENDIRYLGPMNYQHFQMLGWLCIVFSQASVLIALGSKIDASIGEQFASVKDVLGWFSGLSLPFLLIANFSRILNNVEGYKKQLIKNGAAMAGIALATLLFMYRYMMGTAVAVGAAGEQAELLIRDMLTVSSTTKYGFFCFNIFVDLFLCTLVMYFMNYHPKRVFRSKGGLIVFRSFVIFPLAYEAASIVLKIGSASKAITLPLWTFPLLTVKPPMTFALFIILAIYMKTRERRFRRHGKTHKEYQEFLKTKRNSLHFSVFLAIMLVVVSIFDILILVGMTAVRTAASYSKISEGTIGERVSAALELETVMSDEEALQYLAEQGITEEDFDKTELIMYAADSTMVMDAVGFGRSRSLIFLAPLMLLFSYTRVPRNKQLSMFIPMAAMGLIVLLYLEAMYQGLGRFAAEKGLKLTNMINNSP